MRLSVPTTSLAARAFALTAVACTVLPSPTPAARILGPADHYKAIKGQEDRIDVMSPADPVRCDLILEDERQLAADGRPRTTRGIVEGDARKLMDQYEAIIAAGEFHTMVAPMFLCLRSGGGSVQEALKIATFVREATRPSIVTVVEEAETCASACALIFMAGTLPTRWGEWPQRFLHARGRLMFHSSRIDLSGYSDDALLRELTGPSPDKKELRARVMGLYDDGLRDVQAVLNTFNDISYIGDTLGQPWVRPSLFLAVYAQDPSEWVCIDTVDQAGRWNIKIFGYEPPVVAKPQYFRMCRNTHYWRRDSFAAEPTEDPDQEARTSMSRPPPSARIAGRNAEDQNFDDRVVIANFEDDYSRLEEKSCVIESTYFNTQKKLTPFASHLLLFADKTAKQQLSDVYLLEPSAFFPPRTLLAELPHSARPVEPAVTPAANRAPARPFRTFSNSLIEGCAYRSLAGATAHSCQEACNTDDQCVAYSLNETSGRCELKHTLSAIRLDPMWTTGALASGPALQKSIRAAAMEYLHGIEGAPPSVRGTEIEVAKGVPEEQCIARCEGDSDCMALHYFSESETCHRFSDVTGVGTWDDQATPKPDLALIKRQR